MAEKTPSRLWLIAEEIGWPGSFRSFRLTDLEHPEEYPMYVRADVHDKLAAVLTEWLDAEDTWDGDFADDDRLARAKESARAALSSLQTGETGDA